MHTGSLKNGSWMMKSCDLRIDCDMIPTHFFTNVQNAIECRMI